MNYPRPKFIVVGRKRKSGIVRDESGVSREHEKRQRLDYESRLAARGAKLLSEGINPDNANLGLSGFTLGKLFLRWKADKGDPGAISREQYQAGDRFARVCRRHQAVMGYSSEIRLLSASNATIRRGSGIEPTQSEVDDAREDFRACYDALAVQSRSTRGVQELVYGVCIDNRPVDTLTLTDYGNLREGLNALGKALSDLDKRRGQY